METALLILVVSLVILFNLVGVVLTALQLPGTWFILLVTSLAAWWGWGEPQTRLVGIWVLLALLVLAILGEVLEFLAGAVGASKAGGSKLGVLLAVVGGVVGAVAGTIWLSFIPVVGTLVGAALGAGLGSWIGEIVLGRPMGAAIQVGKGAAIGRFWGAVAKLGVAVVMWIVATFAMLG